MASARRRYISEEKRDSADQQIKNLQREVSYDLKDFTIGYLNQEFNNGLFYIPEYQRRFVWRQPQRAKFIESVLLGLPVPFVFVAEMDDGRLEIVDGAQRIQTLESFASGDLKLSKLERLTELNGFRFADLPRRQQNKFHTKALRVIVLSEATTPEIRKEIFDRINTTGERARGSEIRPGAHAGQFMDFVRECANDPLFRKLCPISQSMLKRREDEELILRFFAYSDRYLEFKHDVDKFLEQYVQDVKDNFDKERLKSEFDRTMKFVQKYFPHGFAKTNSAKTTPRVRFEAIAVGVNLALREEPSLRPNDLGWMNSSEFEEHVTTHASNSLPRLKGRVEFVRDKLLES